MLLLLLLAAFGWGALHALSPGHGKAMVAAYLVGTRGRARHAVALGATVTVTHTIGVFALGVVTLALSQYVLAEDLYPWLTLVSGLMVRGGRRGVLRSRLRHARAHAERPAPPRTMATHHEHDLSWKGLLGMGAAAGLIPCPSALVVLLAAISQHEVGARAAADRRLQPRAGRNPHRRWASRWSTRGSVIPRRLAAGGWPPRCPPPRPC